MYLKRIYVFIISSLFFSFWMTAQEPESKTYEKKEKVDYSHERDTYLRIGVDPTRSLQSYLQPGSRAGFDFQADFEYNMKVFPVLEGGWHLFDRNSSKFTFKSYGSFVKIGADYNFLQFKKAEDKDIFFMGLRVAASQFVQRASDINLENVYGSVNSNVSAENYTATWGEFTIGVKTEIAKNWFLGWTARGKLLFDANDAAMPSYIIPGFGKQRALTKTVTDINFYVAYAIPLKRAKK